MIPILWQTERNKVFFQSERKTFSLLLSLSFSPTVWNSGAEYVVIFWFDFYHFFIYLFIEGCNRYRPDFKKEVFHLNRKNEYETQKLERAKTLFSE